MDTKNKKDEVIEEATEIVEQVQQEEPITGDVFDTEQDAIEAVETGEHSGRAMAAGVIVVAAVAGVVWCANKLVEQKTAKRARSEEDGEVDGDVQYRKLSFGERMAAFITGKVKVYPQNEENGEG